MNMTHKQSGNKIKRKKKETTTTNRDLIWLKIFWEIFLATLFLISKNLPNQIGIERRNPSKRTSFESVVLRHGHHTFIWNRGLRILTLPNSVLGNCRRHRFLSETVAKDHRRHWQRGRRRGWRIGREAPREEAQARPPIAAQPEFVAQFGVAELRRLRFGRRRGQRRCERQQEAQNQCDRRWIWAQGTGKFGDFGE